MQEEIKEEMNQIDEQEVGKKKPAIKVLISLVVVVAVLVMTNVTTSVAPVRDMIEKSEIPVISGIPAVLEKIPVVGNAGEILESVVGGQGENSIDTQLDPDYFGEKDIEPLPIVTPRTPEEIAETGVTAQDVLDLLDVMTLNIYKYPRYSQMESYGEYWNQLTAQCHVISTGGDIPFAVCRDSFEPDFAWFVKGAIYECELNEFRDVYFLYFDYTVGLEDRGFSWKYLNAYAVTEEDFVALMKAYNNNPVIVTEEDAERYSDCDGILGIVGMEAYPRIDFTRELIENSNQEQLDALYNMITGSLQTINFENRLPD